MRLFLSEHTGDARPDALIYLRLRDLDAIAKEFGAAVEQMPWGREVRLRDPDGNRVSVVQYACRFSEPVGHIPMDRLQNSEVPGFWV